MSDAYGDEPWNNPCEGCVGLEDKIAELKIEIERFKTDPKSYTPIEVAIALSLYGFNVAPGVRAEKLHDHFKGDCAEPVDLVYVLDKRAAYAATEFAYPTAKVYVAHALERYGEEAKRRVAVNEPWAK